MGGEDSTMGLIQEDYDRHANFYLSARPQHQPSDALANKKDLIVRLEMYAAVRGLPMCLRDT